MILPKAVDLYLQKHIYLYKMEQIYIRRIKLTFFELLFISIGLSADAFAVAVCKGLPIKKVNIKNAGIVGL